MGRMIIYILLFLTTVMPAGVFAGRIPSVEVAAIGTSVEDHIPIGVADSFPSSVGRVYCYTKILDAEGTSITHRWYYNDAVVSDVPLKIGSSKFRTYSYKTILPSYTGAWKVEILSETGDVMETLRFTVEE